ncbi:MAG TPA: hypothetical protein VFZ66_14365 [Herpetosiphonaceae bacterium]
MSTAQSQTQAARPRRIADRDLGLLILGALLLIVVGLISIPLVGRRAPTLAPATTPEGTVQRFYQAVYTGDYNTAYSFISADTQSKLSMVEMQQQLNIDPKNSQIRVRETTVIGTNATVVVTVTYFQPGGIFSSGEWSMDEEVLLQRDGESWKIIGGPFYIPEEPMR